jgi:hypothetical protein
MPTGFFTPAACMEKIICQNSLLPHSSKFIAYKNFVAFHLMFHSLIKLMQHYKTTK